MAPRVGEHLAWLGPREDHVHDGKDSEQVVTPGEGVRILGAEEAHAALAADRDVRDEPDEVDELDDRGTTQPSLDLSDAERSDPPDAEPSGEVPPLPHWTEPPTGAVPA